MTDASRLARVHHRGSYDHLPDDLIEMMLDEAVEDFVAYTNRADPGTEADGVIVEMACIKLNMMGAEGSSGASEGGVSRTWDALPDSLRIRLDRWRRPIYPRTA